LRTFVGGSNQQSKQKIHNAPRTKHSFSKPSARKNKRVTHNMQQTNTAITETQEAK
jgi:hypothetical protein